MGAEALGLGLFPDQEACQSIWWAKMLMDDPLRICRALRFTSKLRFVLHPSFWQAVPFALEGLKKKIPGSVKHDEYLKLGGYGFQAAFDFFDLAFVKTFGPVGQVMRLAPALFGGQNAKTLSDVKSFDRKAFSELAVHLEVVPRDQPSILVSALISTAIFSSDFEGGLGDLSEFTLVCDGMCVSSATRDPGQWLLTCLSKLEAPPEQPGRLELAFAEACQITGEEMLVYLQVWNAFQFTGTAKDWPAAVEPAFKQLVLAMLRKAHPRKADRMEPCAQSLARQRPPVKGSILAKPPAKKGEAPVDTPVDVPRMLTAKVLTVLEVSLRLLQYDDPLDDVAQLNALLTARPALLKALSPNVFYEEDGKTLREEFAPKKGKPTDGNAAKSVSKAAAPKPKAGDGKKGTKQQT